MLPERNMGDRDRIVRGVAGVWLLATALSAALDDRRVTATTLGIAGVGLLGNALSGRCGGNRLLGIDTTGRGEDEAGR